MGHSVFWVPPEARWDKLQAAAKSPEIGKVIDNAMDAIEKENRTLKGVLPKIARPTLDKTRLGELIDLIGTIELIAREDAGLFGPKNRRSQDTLGQVYRYFLGRFAAAEGKAGGDRGEVGIDKAEAIAKMLEKHEVIVGMLHGFDHSAIFSDNPATRVGVISATMNHIHERDHQEGKTDQSDSLAGRFINEVSLLSKAFALAVPADEALRIRDEVGFFEAVRAGLVKYSGIGAKSPEDLDHAIRQLVSKAIATDRVIDIFADAGLKKPEISILSDEFLAEVSGLPHKNLALELLRKLLNDEVKARSRKNVVEARSFLEMLEKTIKLYQNRSIETAEVIAKLIELAREMREAHKRGENLGLTDDELAFYDALEVNDSAVKVLGDDTLRTIARELVESVRNNVTIDWAVKESAAPRCAPS